MINFTKQASIKVIVIIRLLIIVLLVWGFINPNYRLYLFAISGFISGLYYGWHNDIIWNKNGELEKPHNYRIHQLWIHIIGGFIGAIALYFLFCSRNISQINRDELKLTDLVLLLIATLGYAGLFPRSLWFIASHGDLKKL
jgi:hypothetical protein